MTYSMRLKRAGAIGATLLAAAALGGCFGGGDDDDDDNGAPPATDTVPASAAVSVTEFAAFLRGLAVSDTTEPLLLGDLVAPTSDTEEPVAVN